MPRDEACKGPLVVPFFLAMTLLRRSRILLALPLLAALTGCGASAPAAPAAYPGDVVAASVAAPEAESPSQAAPQSPAPAPAQPSAPLGAASAPAAKAGASAPATPPKARDTRSAKSAGPSTRAPVIIYQGDLRMVAEEAAIPKTIDEIIDVAESVGGHIKGRKDQSVVIKVPSASFRETMTKIDALGAVVGRSVTADDVSEEFHDLEVRLGNLRATRVRLQDFLAKASGIADMLTVERELERVAQEIDRIEGRLEFLRTRAAMSVISVQLVAKPKSVAVVATPPPPPPRRHAIDLPISWIGEVGIDPLLSLKK